MQKIVPSYDRKYVSELCASYPVPVQKTFKKLCLHAYVRATKESLQYHAPSRDFEKHQHISNISTHWIMPEGYTPRKLEFEGAEKMIRKNMLQRYLEKHPERKAEFGDLLETLKQETTHFYQSMYDELKRLNPQLAKISINSGSFSDQFDVVHGCASYFSAEDIRYFIHDLPNMSEAEREADFSWLISKKVKWRPSPETKEKIVTALSQHNPPSTLLNELLQPHPLNPYNQTEQSL